MTESYFDDQQLTAYVLGELSADDVVKFEERLKTEPQLQAAVDELRELTGLIAHEFHDEPAMSLSADQRARVADAMPPDCHTASTDVSKRSSNERSRMGIVAVVATCAALLVAAIIFDRSQSAVESTNATQQLASAKSLIQRDDSGVSIPATFDDLVVDGYMSDTKKAVGSFDVTTKPSENPNAALFDQPMVAAGAVIDLPEDAFGGIDADPLSLDISQSTEIEVDPNTMNTPRDEIGVLKVTSGAANGGEWDRRKLVSKPAIRAGRGVTNDGQDGLSVDPGATPAPVTRSNSRGGRIKLPAVDFNLQEAGLGTPTNATNVVSNIENSKAKKQAAQQQSLDMAHRKLLTKLAKQQSELTRLSDAPAAKNGFSFYVDMDRGKSKSDESYAPLVENPFIQPQGTAALSTFSIDVDTASYSNVRRFVQQDQWPPANSVRIEELINYFNYGYEAPSDNEPFSVHVEANPCPWNVEHQLVQIGLQGRAIPKEDRPPINLVFLIDVSGSMKDNNKLPLVKSALELLVAEMTEDDRIAIVTYASGAGVQLESTCGSERDVILSKIHSLSAGGSTNGEAGIQMAYDTAMKNFQDEGNNRVILCTDGDFNVGVSSDSALVSMIQEKARSNVFLSIFGFGMGNLKDSKLEGLADKGNGHYAYIDGIKEAKKVFVEEMTGTLFTIAKDVKIQVEFNPAHVGEYRLIGYENRLLAAQDFADDTKDAGEIGAGHRVTALYEVVPVEVAVKEAARKAALEPKLKYQNDGKPDEPTEDTADEAKISDAAGDASTDPVTPELLTVSLRYKQPDGDTSQLIERAVNAEADDDSASPSPGFQWAAAVASFGMVLRDSQFRGKATLEMAAHLVQQSTLPDENGHRQEFANLIQKARVIHARRTGKTLSPYPKLTDADALKKATVNGKYTTLLKTLKAEQDHNQYGPFKDFGKWDGTSYAGVNDLPPGYWVYVSPNWYIWESTTEQANSKQAKQTDPTDTKSATP